MYAKFIKKTILHQDKVALRNVTFGVAKNEIVGIVGPNGAGKSTLINILTRQLDPDDGQIVVGDLEDRLSSRIPLVGFCPQENILWDELTAEEHIRTFGMIKGLLGDSLDEEASFLLTSLGIPRGVPVGELSGGHQRLVSLAIAFVASPRIVILDEPSKNLDPVERRGLWDLTKKLSRNNSVMLTSHLMEEVELVCNRVAFMINGVLTCIDRPSAMKDKIDSGLYLKIDLKSYLFFDEKSRRTNKFLLLKRLQKLIPELRYVSSTELSITYHVLKKSPTTQAQIFTILTKLDDYNIDTWAIYRCSLEDVFLNYMNKYSQNKASKPSEAQPSIPSSSPS